MRPLGLQTTPWYRRRQNEKRGQAIPARPLGNSLLGREGQSMRGLRCIALPLKYELSRGIVRTFQGGRLKPEYWLLLLQ